MDIRKLYHPVYDTLVHEWAKWWSCYIGGLGFKSAYLRYNNRFETEEDYQLRKSLTPVDRDAGIAIDRVKESIAIRLSDVRRLGGPTCYQERVEGKYGGVDRKGSSMNMFLSRQVLPHLLVEGGVGIYVDRDPFNGITEAQNIPNKPYVYTYSASDLCSWAYYRGVEGFIEPRALLLRDENEVHDPETGLIVGNEIRYRQVWINERGLVSVRYWTPSMAPDPTIAEYDYQAGEIIELNLTRIPFIWCNIALPLMANIADHQIAILNLLSSQCSYGYGANFPIYVEQKSMKLSPAQLESVRVIVDENGVQVYEPVTGPGRGEQVVTGPLKGRSYPTGTEAPRFIHPSSEPMKAAMDLVANIREGIDRAIALDLSTIGAHASAESKDRDKQTLEGGLAAIGGELCIAEQKIAEYWAEYVMMDAATVKYPTNYALLTDNDRIEGAQKLQKLLGAAPSNTYKRELSSLIADRLLANRIPQEKLLLIHEEIETSPYLASDAESVKIDVELGLVSKVVASTARGYDGETQVPIANLEHEERLRRLVISQTAGAAAARGNPDASPVPDGAKLEKKVSQDNPDAKEIKDMQDDEVDEPSELEDNSNGSN